MNGIDIASYQAGIDLTKVPCDFVIVKATQGTRYVNPDYARATKQALAAGKLLGVYHYASSGGAVEEADHFLKTVEGVLGQAILVLDWEKNANANYINTTYAKRWLDRIFERTGVRPFIYMSKSVCKDFNWSRVAAAYPLWVAQYANMEPTGYKLFPWSDASGYGAWEKPSIFQYSSRGKLNGWDGYLDLDKSYLSAKQWRSASALPVNAPEVKAGDVYTVAGYALTDVKYGDQSEAVRFLQTLLNANGYDCGPADGIFGDKTLNALADYMVDKKLTRCTNRVWTSILGG